MTHTATRTEPASALAPGKFFPRQAETSTSLKISALTRNPDTIRCIRTLMQTENFANQWHLWMGESVQLAALVEQEHPQVLLLEDDGLVENELDALGAVIDRSPDLNVILISGRQTPEFLLGALRAGVREVIPLPVSIESLRESMDGIRQRLAAGRTPRPQGRIMAWMSSKGGAGATFLATNLAAALAASGKRVCFIDLNFHFGEASFYVSEARPDKTIADVLQQIQRLDGPLLESSMQRVAPNFWLLPAPESPETMGEIPPRGIESLLNVARANFDFVILDVHRSLDSHTISALDKADEIHLVVQMTLPFLRDATRLLRVFGSLGYARERVKVLVNRFEKKSDISLKELEQTLDVRGPSTVPNSYAAVAIAINQGRPIVELAPNNPVSRALRELANAHADIAEPDASWLQRLLKR